jgi:tripartite-type tricarboxylate transporter receptor subunit TctC
MLKSALAAFAIVLPTIASYSYAQTYPTRPVRMIIPYPAGGGTTTIGRLLAQKVAEDLGQGVVVDNRGGANGTIGMELAAQAPPDGYTIVLPLTAQVAINPAFYPKLPYDPIRDYTPVTLLGSAPYVLIAHPSVAAKTVKDVLALAKSKPGQLTCASSGTGGIPHLALEMLKSMGHVDIVHVPYKGGGAALPDLLGGQVQFLFVVVSTAMPLARSGKVNAIGVTSLKRSASMPDVPAIAETLPGYSASTWYAILAPARTPANIVSRLNASFVKALRFPDVTEKLKTFDFEPVGSTPQQLAQFMRSEMTRWAKVVKDSGVKPD